MYKQINNYPTTAVTLRLPEEVFEAFFELLIDETYSSTEVMTSVYTVDNEVIEDEVELDEDNFTHQLLVDMSIARDEEFVEALYANIEELNEEFEGINIKVNLENLDFINVFIED